MCRRIGSDEIVSVLTREMDILHPSNKLLIRKTRIRRVRSSSDGERNDIIDLHNQLLLDDVDSYVNRSRSFCIQKDACVDTVSVQEIINSICEIVLFKINQSTKNGYSPDEEYSLFNLGGAVFLEDNGVSVEPPVEQIPTNIQTITDFVTFIHDESQLEYDCLVISMIYLERMLKLSQSKFQLCAENWRAAIFTCTMVASKVWDDFAMKNAEFSSMIESLSVDRTNKMEYKLLALFEFNIGVSVHEYTEYNCKLINMARAKKRQNLQLLFKSKPRMNPFDEEKKSEESKSRHTREKIKPLPSRNENVAAPSQRESRTSTFLRKLSSVVSRVLPFGSSNISKLHPVEQDEHMMSYNTTFHSSTAKIYAQESHETDNSIFH